MSTTISKITFFDNCYIELYRKNDGGHRIKWVSPNGDEFTLNLSQDRLIDSNPSLRFEEVVFSVKPDGFDGVGSQLRHNIALWNLLINSDSYMKNVISQLGKEIKDDGVSSIVSSTLGVESL